MKTCGRCGKPVPVVAKVGDICQHCGARWDFERVTYTSRPSPPPSPLMRKLVWLFLAAGLLLALIIPFFARHKPARSMRSATHWFALAAPEYYPGNNHA